MATFVVHADKAEDLKLVSLDVSELSEVLYVTQVADLRDIYESRFGEDTWFDLKPDRKAEFIRVASSYLEYFNEGSYSWMDSLTDSLRTVLGDLPDVNEDLVP